MLVSPFFLKRYGSSHTLTTVSGTYSGTFLVLYSTLRKITLTYKTYRNLLYIYEYIWLMCNVFNGGVVGTLGTNKSADIVTFFGLSGELRL